MSKTQLDKESNKAFLHQCVVCAIAVIAFVLFPPSALITVPLGAVYWYFCELPVWKEVRKASVESIYNLIVHDILERVFNCLFLFFRVFLAFLQSWRCR